MRSKYLTGEGEQTRNEKKKGGSRGEKLRERSYSSDRPIDGRR